MDEVGRVGEIDIYDGCWPGSTRPWPRSGRDRGGRRWAALRLRRVWACSATA